ncbi:MAG: six-hairpin glycosidase [Ferruginibacter sp.]
MKIKIVLTFIQLFALLFAGAQEIKIPSPVTPTHPRILTGSNSRESIKKLIESAPWAAKIYNEAKKNIDVYVNKNQLDSTWIVSRLQMYWNTKSTDVFIKGGVYDHASGEAPVPTVKFPGTRDNISIYTAPKLDSILPYMDDARGVYLVNKTKPGQPMEWAEIAKTGRIIESINTQIMQMANTAAMLYWINGEDKYARFAFNLFDTYMTGMYYRKLPVDITHGHHQTITSLSTFEVIQEVAMLNQLTGIYDYTYDYIQHTAPGKIKLYAATFKKWADVQIQNGVAFNNWNLMQAKNVLNIGLILDNNDQYEDKKGSGYYTDQVLNKSSERQWSIVKLINEGYDSNAGLWYESPGYSLGVLGDFTSFIGFFDRYYNLDILTAMPVLSKAVIAAAQYLFPNGYTSSFGDSHYRRITTAAALDMVANAQKNNKKDPEEIFTKYIKAINDLNERTGLPSKEGLVEGTAGKNLGNVISTETNIVLKENIPAGKMEAYVTPVFYSPNVSYLALRNGIDPKNGLMVAMSGSKGNHMHAGGISMEIFGKGIVLGPESGIGTSYFQQDYAEYYSQFPAHNTVAVDGISAYPVMKSNHGFELLSSYPASGIKEGYFPQVCFGEMFFTEPETMSDQNRLTSIIKTTDSTGYYVDIFRSKRRDGKDKMHDYFYHNLGQQVTLSDSRGKAFDLEPTQQLSFAGGHLFAYDYFYDKKSIKTSEDYNAVFQLSIAGRNDVRMNMWMKGSAGREIFSVKAPPSKAFGNNAMIPDSIAALPMPTIVARQTGEAWKHPFVAVFEPSVGIEPRSVTSINAFNAANATDDFVGLAVENLAGNKDFIFSAIDANADISFKEKSFRGTYAVISEHKKELRYLFLGSGKKIASNGYSIIAKTGNTSAALENKNNEWFFCSSAPVSLTLPFNILSGKTIIQVKTGNSETTYFGKSILLKGQKVIVFDLPAIAYSAIIF